MTRKTDVAWWHEFEIVIHRIVPYTLVLLLFIIITELLHTLSYITIGPALQAWLNMMNYVVLFIFVLDLLYIARRCDSTMYFFKNYWLDIIAVFPFAIFFRVLNEFNRLFYFARQVRIGQGMLQSMQGQQVASRTRIITRSLRFISKGMSRR